MAPPPPRCSGQISFRPDPTPTLTPSATPTPTPTPTANPNPNPNQVQQALLGDNAAGLWQELSTAWSSAHCVGVEHRAQPGEEPAEMQDTGLLANVCYCATTGGLTLTLALTLALTLTLPSPSPSPSRSP